MTTTSDLSGAAVGRPARTGAGDIPDGLRTAFVVAILLLVWVRLDPFHDLSSVSNIEASDGGSLATQVAFSLVGIAVGALLYRLGTGSLRALATRPYILTAGWMAVSIVFSVSPALSLRRAILLAIAILASAAIMLAARSVRHFADLLAGTALVVVAVSYVSLAVVPDLAMHTALDLREPEHAGAWRGPFSHKNEAGAVMAVFVFIGLFAFSLGRRALGGALAVLAAIFLAFTASKTAIALLPIVLLGTSLCRLVKSSLGRALILLGPLALLLTIALGSLFFPPVKDAVSSVLSDVTFTGRAEIWNFTVENILARPVTGWGYGAFWKTEATLYGGSEQLTWVNQADQAHNGYLDTALFMGLPGLALTGLVFLWLPLRDLHRASSGAAPDAAAMFFGRLWLFGISTAAFESIFYDATSAVFFMFAMAVLGLRYLADHGTPES